MLVNHVQHRERELQLLLPMEMAASIPAPRRCQLRQLVTSKAPSVLAPRSTLPRHLPALAASSCPSRDGHRRVQHQRGVRAASESADVSSFGPATWRPPRGRAPLQFDGRGPRAARASSGGNWDPDRDRKEAAPLRRPRLLCLHGFRTSGEIMRRQVVGRWAPEVTARLDLVFADAPFPAEGASPVAGVLDFDPPYYEWCQFAGDDFLSCRNLDECFSYLEELMDRDGPFDGLLGFSQGAGLSAVLAGLQQQGLAFTGVAKVKCVIVIAGAKVRAPVDVARAFDSKITCPSLHFIGDEDFVKVHSEELVQAFVDPLVIRHPCGHTVPKLDEKGLQTMLTYLDRIEREIWEHSSTDTEIMGSN